MQSTSRVNARTQKKSDKTQSEIEMMNSYEYS